MDTQLGNEKKKKITRERTQLGSREVGAVVEAVRWMREALGSQCLPAGWWWRPAKIIETVNKISKHQSTM